MPPSACIVHRVNFVEFTPAKIVSASFSTDGEWLATLASDGVVTLYNCTTGRLTVTLSTAVGTEEATPIFVCWLTPLLLVVLNNGQTIAVSPARGAPCDAHVQRALRQATPALTHTLVAAFAPPFLALGTSSGTTRILQVECVVGAAAGAAPATPDVRASLRHALRVADAPISALALTSEGPLADRLVAIASLSGDVLLYSLGSGACVGALDVARVRAAAVQDRRAEQDAARASFGTQRDQSDLDHVSGTINRNTVMSLAFGSGEASSVLCGGDSRGVTSLWNLDTLTLETRVVTHAGPILAMVALDESFVGAGVDAQLVSLSRAPDEARTPWLIRHRLRSGMSHDILTLAASSTAVPIPGGLQVGKSVVRSEMRYVVAAGVDATLTCFDAASVLGANRYTLARLPPVPDNRRVAAVHRGRRLVVAASLHSLSIYTLGRPASLQVPESPVTEVPFAPDAPGNELLAEINLTHGDPSPICCLAVSRSATFIAVSTVRSLLLYAVAWPDVADGSGLVLPAFRRIAKAPPAVALAFAGDDSLLVVERTSCRLVQQPLPAPGARSVDPVVVVDVGAPPTSIIDRTRLVTVSTDGLWLATSATVAPDVRIFRRPSTNDAFAFFDTAAGPPHSTVTACSFNEDATSLVIVGSTNTFVMHTLDAVQGRAALSDWSRAFSETIPTKLTAKREKVYDIIWKPTSDTSVGRGQQFTLVSSWWLATVDLVASPSADDAVRVVTKYGSILAADFVSDKELVVVEVPFQKRAGKMEAPLKRKRYGNK
uniref:Uncharacterized protein n=1 Tax=Sexangularia sp. CB-2014 TaxID=1486929 RepID=A0A7S1VQK5_9EUKA|mmetsp:Transcript_8139/g.26007  ORF Transcript_8139/g.26007 Transcript_8139/m.26007 type:complete len:774 (+) Transcript_8139:97-2418(+)